MFNLENCSWNGIKAKEYTKWNKELVKEFLKEGGLVVTDLRPPLIGEAFLSAPFGTLMLTVVEHTAGRFKDRFIVSPKPKFSYQLSKTITPTEVYGQENPEVPEGYEIVDFRPPKKGENFLVFYESAPASFNFGETEPRFILKKKIQTLDISGLSHSVKAADVYGKEKTILSPPEGYEFTGEFRNPKAGEYVYLGVGATRSPQINDPESWTESPRLILRKLLT